MLYKVKILFLCCLLCSSKHLPAQETPPQQQPTCFDRLSTPIIVGCLGILYWLTAPQENKDALLRQLTPSNLAVNFLQEYTSWALTTLSHETGHALAARMLTGNAATIHYGSTQTPQQPLLRIGRLHIDGLDPKSGSTVITTKSSLSNKRQMTAFLLAGGIAGIIGHHLIQLCTSKNIRIDAITIQQMISALVPYHHDSDGALLWRNCAGVSEDKINFLIRITPYIEMAAEAWCAAHDPHATEQSPLHASLLIGMINYFLRGYLRLHT
jgi:hypothetical protein